VPNAVQLIGQLSRSLDDVVIGAGTVTDVKTADDVITAGAQFVVSPVFRPELITACHARDVAVVPGCFTPTEILGAWERGADIVKVFPSTALGPTFFRDLRGPLPQVKLMPTGGVTLQNAGEWIAAGAVAIGVGSALVDPKAVSAARFDLITGNARQFVDAVRAARGAQAVGR
jgi:2-dehydro-3-deoxyphosphogluconate aldolase/(4S)-4-hydroxy-2-oxoglutarate aldolase